MNQIVCAFRNYGIKELIFKNYFSESIQWTIDKTNNVIYLETEGEEDGIETESENTRRA